MFEIELSKLALKKKVAADQAFARRLVHDHTQTTEQLKHLVNGGKVKAQLPVDLDDEHKQMLEKLRGESGADFSKDYNQMQLAGHKEAVALFEAYGKSGDNEAQHRSSSLTRRRSRQERVQETVRTDRGALNPAEHSA